MKCAFWMICVCHQTDCCSVTLWWCIVSSSRCETETFVGPQLLWMTACSVTLGGITVTGSSTWRPGDPCAPLSWVFPVLLLAVKLCEVFHCKTLLGDKEYILSSLMSYPWRWVTVASHENARSYSPQPPLSCSQGAETLQKPTSSGHFHREESQLQAIILCYMCLSE